MNFDTDSSKAQLEVTKLPVNNSNIPAVKTPVMVLYEKVGNGNVQFSPAVAVSGGFRITVALRMNSPIHQTFDPSNPNTVFTGCGRSKKSAQHHAAHLALLDLYREYVELPSGAGLPDGTSGNMLDADGDYKMEESSGMS